MEEQVTKIQLSKYKSELE